MFNIIRRRNKMQARHTIEELKAIGRFDTPTLVNALETFEVIPPNTGFCGPEMRCLFPELGMMVGYAVTSRSSFDQPPGAAQTIREEDYLRCIAAQPGPKVAVSQDMDNPPVGAGWGEWWSNVHQALGCVGVVSQGGVRDLEGMRRLGFHCFATHVLVSHGYDVLVDNQSPDFSIDGYVRLAESVKKRKPRLTGKDVRVA